MSLFSTKHLKSLVTGDQITTPGLLTGMAPDSSLIWELLEPEPGIKDYLFRVTYFGVSLGDLRVKPGKRPQMEWL